MASLSQNETKAIRNMPHILTLIEYTCAVGCYHWWGNKYWSGKYIYFIPKTKTTTMTTSTVKTSTKNPNIITWFAFFSLSHAFRHHLTNSIECSIWSDAVFMFFAAIFQNHLPHTIASISYNHLQSRNKCIYTMLFLAAIFPLIHFSVQKKYTNRKWNAIRT